MNEKKKDVLLSIGASLVCIVIGLLVGLIILFCINSENALDGFVRIVKGGFYLAPKGVGSEITQAAPLIMTGLSVAFAFKTGLFNIGAAGQYTVGVFGALYFAIILHMPWYVCLLAAMVCGAIWGAVPGFFKAYFNVNEVISCIMLNWISLYIVNMLLTQVKAETTPYTVALKSGNTSALLPNCGLDGLFAGNEFVTIGLPLSVLMAVLVWIILGKTKFGYELKATGMNKHAAKYCGMKEKRNIILTMMISGGLAGMGAAFFYLSGIETWMVQQTSVPSMGFNGIAAAFLGGLDPIGTIFASYFIQHITSGGTYVDKTMYCTQISDLISAVIIYLCGFVFFFKLWFNRYLNKKDEKKEVKGGTK